LLMNSFVGSTVTLCCCGIFAYSCRNEQHHYYMEQLLLKIKAYFIETGYRDVKKKICHMSHLWTCQFDSELCSHHMNISSFLSRRSCLLFCRLLTFDVSLTHECYMYVETGLFLLLMDSCVGFTVTL